MHTFRKIMKKYGLTIILILLSLIGYLLTLITPHFPSFMEHYYSQGINKLYRQGLSLFFGLFPFSVYEFLLYGVILIVLASFCYRFYQILIKRTHWKKHLSKWLIHILNFALVLWCLLIYTWTLNYSRLPLENTMSLELSTHSTEELADLYSHLIEKLNALSFEVTRDENGYMTIPGGYQNVFPRTKDAYEALSKDYPQFGGRFGNPKPVTLSKLMVHTNITGIYSPFTSEPNVCTAILPQDLPATAIHELAHLRGIAPEDEANFVATLTCTYSQDVDFKYSGYFLALIHASNALYKASPETLYALNASLNEAVRLDLEHHNAFWQSYQGTTSKISSTLNDSYLKANGVADGEASYGRMVDLLLAYYKKHPHF